MKTQIMPNKWIIKRQLNKYLMNMFTKLSHDLK